MTLVRVATYRDPVEAHLARALLDAAGIPAHIADEHTIGANWEYSQLLGGAKLFVPTEAEQQARELLAAGAAAEPERAEVPDASAGSGDLSCPHCGGTGARLARLDRRIRAFSMLIPLPLTIGRYRVRCAACHRTWRALPPHRGLRFVIGDLLALILIAVGALISLPFRVFRGGRHALAPARFACWSCGAEFRAGEAACPACRIALPGAIAYGRFVRPGRAYDGTCTSCRLPFANVDYASGAHRRCSSCGAALPSAR